MTTVSFGDRIGLSWSAPGLSSCSNSPFLVAKTKVGRTVAYLNKWCRSLPTIKVKVFGFAAIVVCDERLGVETCETRWRPADKAGQGAGSCVTARSQYPAASQ